MGQKSWKVKVEGFNKIKFSGDFKIRVKQLIERGAREAKNRL